MGAINRPLRFTRKDGEIFHVEVALVYSFLNQPTVHPEGWRDISPLLLMATILFSSIALLLTGTLAAWIGMGVSMAVVFLLIRHIPRPVIFVLVGITLAAIIFQTYLSGRLKEYCSSHLPSETCSGGIYSYRL